MKKIIFLLAFFLLTVLSFKFLALSCSAQQEFRITPERVGPTVSPSPKATEAPEATESASEEATEAALPIKKIEKKPDITEPQPETLGKLEKILSDNPVEPLNPTNFLQHAIREAVKRGVPANTIVLILLFPIVAALVAFTRHYIGLEGFGIFTPAVISVALLAVGITSGIILFVGILAAATLARVLLRKIRLQYLPRMALLLWVVSLGVFLLLFLSTYLNLEAIITVSIFPILLLILLAEDFISAQYKASMRQAISRTATTLLIAVACFGVLNLELLQRFVLLHPEATVLSVAIFDYILGKFTGLRLLEYKRFREVIQHG